MALSLCQAAAHVNSMHIIAADRVGVERGQPFIGQSVIVGPTGWPLCEPASSAAPRSSPFPPISPVAGGYGGGTSTMTHP